MTASPPSPPDDAPPAGARRALALLAFALVFGLATWFSATAVLPQLREEWGLGRTEAAWLTLAVQLGFVAGALTSAITNLPDIVSPKRVVVGGALAAGVANLLVTAAGGLTAAVPLRFATGFALAFVYGPALKLMATWYRRGRGTALGVLVGALTVGSAAPHLVNAGIGLGWQEVVGAASLLSFAAALIVAAGVREGPFPFARATFDPRQIRLVLANRRVRLATGGYLGHMWELYAMWAWFAVFFADVLERDGRGDVTNLAALATFAVIAAGGPGSWVGGRMGDTIGRATTTAWLMAGSGASALVIGLIAPVSPWLVLAVGLFWGFTVVADSAQFSTLVTEYADQAYVGTALTVQLALGFTLTVATIWLVPLAVDVVGWRFAFCVLVPGPVLGTLSMLRLRSVEGRAAGPAA